MNKSLLIAAITVAVLASMLVCTSFDVPREAHAQKSGLKDSSESDFQSCRKCHARFFSSWDKSPHGLSVHLYSRILATEQFEPLEKGLAIDDSTYTLDIRKGYVTERGSLPWGGTRYQISSVMGGGRLLHFLTPLEKGKMQILPLAYDTRDKRWFDVTAEGIMHAQTGAASWKEYPYTLKTDCYGCHVNRLDTNYDQNAERYADPNNYDGIGCGSCHGATDAHVSLAGGLGAKGAMPEDMRIIRFKKLDPVAINQACAVCHAKATPITNSYVPGEDFFDHNDLAALEDPDFFADGSNRNASHIYTRWLMSPCLEDGRIHCLMCHTAGGGFKYSGDKQANNACAACHAQQVQRVSEHSHHKPGSTGSVCISCHMPKLTIGRTEHTDHSMLPPAPAVSMALKSTDACTNCHDDRDAAWANMYVRRWHRTDYQTPILKESSLIEAARRSDWSRLSEMIDYIQGSNNEVVAASLIRMLKHSPDPKVTSALVHALKDPSPLVRSSAAEALSGVSKPKVTKALLDATADTVRLVRIKAASSLARVNLKGLRESEATNLEKATAEYLSSMVVLPDNWQSQYNMGRYFLDRGEYKDAILANEKAVNIEPKAVPPYIGLSQAYLGLRNSLKAEGMLNKALKLDPESAPAHYQMGLLRKRQGTMRTAEESFREALRYDPTMHDAAYNLCLILSQDRMKEALAWGQKAFHMHPDVKVGYTLATLQKKDGNWDASLSVLKQIVSTDPSFTDAYLLMGEIYEGRAKKKEAKAVYLKGIASEDMPESDKNKLQLRLNRLNK